MSDGGELEFQQTVTAEREALQDTFAEWVQANYAPMWDDRLCDLMQDGDVQVAFLRDAGLPEETEI